MKLKQYIARIKNSIWIYPVVYSLLAFLLAALVILLDNGYLIDLRPYMPVIFLTSADLAKSVLGIISSAFINITTFTFSTTMVVLTIYMSEFSPRVVENFLSDQRTMKSFGIFVSGFIYSIVCMLFIREEVLTQPIIAGTIGVIYIIFGLFNFILFINSVGKHIQASNLIERLYEHTRKDIDAYQEEINQHAHILKENMNENVVGKKISSNKNGYIQQIDYEQILDIAQKYEANILFNKVIGKFVTKEIEIGELLSVSKDTDPNEVMEELQNAILVGSRRTEEQDFSFSIQKIVEVALRSLSPGINDPNTAIFCIHNLGLLLGQLSSLSAGYVVMEEEEKKGSLYRESYDMDQLLKDTFLQMIHYGEEDVYVMIAILDAYSHLTYEAEGTNRELIREHAKYLFDRLMNSYEDEMERGMIIESYEKVLKFGLEEEYV